MLGYEAALDSIYRIITAILLLGNLEIDESTLTNSNLFGLAGMRLPALAIYFYACPPPLFPRLLHLSPWYQMAKFGRAAGTALAGSLYILLALFASHYLGFQLSAL